MKIIELKSKNGVNDFNEYFNKNLNTDKLQIVAFLANWCGFCEQFKPEWEKFKSIANKELINGVVTTASEENMDKLNCDKNIEGFPTIRIYKNGKYIDYDGERDSKNLVKYVKNIESESSLPYFKQLKNNKSLKTKNLKTKSLKSGNLKKNPNNKIKITISQKKYPLNSFIEPIETDISSTKDYLTLSEENKYGLSKTSEEDINLDAVKNNEIKLKEAKKKISKHIISKLKELSKKLSKKISKKSKKKISKMKKNTTIKSLRPLVKKMKQELYNLNKKRKRTFKKKKKRRRKYMNKKTAKKRGGSESETTHPTLGKAASDAAKGVLRGAAKLVEETGKMIGKTGEIVGNAADTTKDVLKVTGDTSTEILKAAGDATTHSIKTLASSVKVVSVLSENLASITKNKAQIREEKDKLKLEAIKDEKVKEKLIEKEKEKQIAEAGLKLAKIKLEFELKKAKDLNAAEIRMAKDNRDQEKERALLEVKKELSNVENNIIKSGATCIKNLHKCYNDEDCTLDLLSNKKFKDFRYKGSNGREYLCNYFTLCEKYGQGRNILRLTKRKYCDSVKKMVRHANEYANSNKMIGGSRKKQHQKKSIGKNNKNNKNKSRKKTKKRKV